MNRISSVKFRVALLLLPILIFLLFVSVSYAKNSSQIKATVNVVPAAATKCQPDPFITKSVERKFTCFIELDNFDVSKIIPSTLRLSLVEAPVAPISISSNSPNMVGDFDKNGMPDLKVTFEKKKVDSWFSTLFLPKDFTFKITGEIDGIPDYTFVSLDKILVIRPTITTVRFFGEGGSANVVKGIDLSNAKIKTSRINRIATQEIACKIGQDSTCTTSDLIKKTAHIAGEIGGTMPVTVSRRIFNVPFSIWVKYDGDNCTFNPPSSLTCDGKGRLFKKLIFGLFEEKANIHFETDGETGSITAKQGDVKVFELIDVPLENFDFDIKPR